MGAAGRKRGFSDESGKDRSGTRHRFRRRGAAAEVHGFLPQAAERSGNLCAGVNVESGRRLLLFFGPWLLRAQSQPSNSPSTPHRPAIPFPSLTVAVKLT